MTGITVSFANLTKDQAEELIELYASFSGVGDLQYGDARVSGQRHTAEPLPNPAPRAPSAPTTPQVAAGSAEITHDNNGVPFHPDYHSGVRKLNDDGSWKARRGVDKAAYKAFNAANARATIGAPPAAPQAPSPAMLNQQFGAPPVPQMPAITVDQWVAKCTELYGANKWTEQFVGGMNAACGVADQSAYMQPENAAARTRSYELMLAA